MRIYLTPKVGSGTRPDPYRAKYFTAGPEQVTTALTRALRAAKGEAWMVVESDVTPDEHAALITHDDVREMSDPLSDDEWRLLIARLP